MNNHLGQCGQEAGPEVGTGAVEDRGDAGDWQSPGASGAAVLPRPPKIEDLPDSEKPREKMDAMGGLLA